MAKIYTVTYLGKPGKSNDESLPYPGIHPPFAVGVPEVFDEARLRSLGVDPDKADDFITGPEGFVTLANANRAKGLELFKVEVSDPTDDEPTDDKPKLSKTKSTSTPPAKK